MCPPLRTALLYGHRHTCHAIAQQFLEHAEEEHGHADIAAERITQLGSAPNFDPDGLSTRSHAQYVEGNSPLDMVRDDLIPERIAVESYKEIIRYLGDVDPIPASRWSGSSPRKKSTPTI